MLSEDTGGEHIEKAHREQERNHVMLRFTQHDIYWLYEKGLRSYF